MAHCCAPPEQTLLSHCPLQCAAGPAQPPQPTLPPTQKDTYPRTCSSVSAGLRPWPTVTSATTAITPPTSSRPAAAATAGGSILGPSAHQAQCPREAKASAAYQAPSSPPAARHIQLGRRCPPQRTLLAAQPLPRRPVGGGAGCVQLPRLHSKDVGPACRAGGAPAAAGVRRARASGQRARVRTGVACCTALPFVLAN